MSTTDYCQLLRMRYLSDMEGLPDTVQTIAGVYTSMRHPQVFFRALIQVVLQGGIDSEPSVTPQSDENETFGMSHSAVSQAAAELIKVRHKLASNVVLVLLAVSHLRVPASHKVPSSLLAESVAAFHSLCVLTLLAEKRIEARLPSSQLNPSGSILSRMSALSVDNSPSAQQFTASTLLFHLLQHHYLPKTSSLSSDSLTVIASDWITRLGITPYPPAKSIKITHAVLTLAHKLIAFGHTQIALDILDQYPKTAGACFLLGQIWLDKVDFEKAKRFFEQGAVGLGERLLKHGCIVFLRIFAS